VTIINPTNANDIAQAIIACISIPLRYSPLLNIHQVRIPVAYLINAYIIIYNAQKHHIAVCLSTIKQITEHTRNGKLKVRAPNKSPKNERSSNAKRPIVKKMNPMIFRIGKLDLPL
jgi:dTDP-4-dehydrorhamnose reductase